MRFKLSPFAYARLFGLHSWAGVVSSLVLYVMFVTGGIALFREPLQVWEDPAAQDQGGRPSLEDIVARVRQSAGGVPDELWLELPRGGRATRLAFSQGGSWKAAWLGGRDGQVVLARERLSTFLYDLHFLWHDLTGQGPYVLAGLLAAAMLLALATGVLVHLKDLWRQLHQFRPHQGRRYLWWDLHKVTGIMGLPFQLMYAYTGALIVLGPLVLKVFVGPVFDGDEARARRFASGVLLEHTEDITAAPAAKTAVVSLDVLLSRATELVPGFAPEQVHLLHHGRPEATVTFSALQGLAPQTTTEVRLRECDGVRLPTAPATGPVASMRRWILGLHLARFGGVPLRFLFFGLALAAALTLLSGNWIWLERHPSGKGHALLRRLTVGLGAGLWVGLGALFLTSRLLSLGWGPRGTVEELTFTLCLLACTMAALASRAPGTLWSRYLAVAAGLFFLVPFIPLPIVGRGGSMVRPAAALGVDVALVVLAAALATTAVLLRPRIKRAGRVSAREPGSGGLARLESRDA
jgi:uncharacterized iron-regulated membrane protein